MNMLKAAIIGLGNIGFLFSLDQKRKGTWSHAAAYEKAGGVRLAGAVEPDAERTGMFSERYRDVPVYSSIRELMETTDVDIVSVCTPADTHYSILKELAAYPVKAVFCEKPLTLDIHEAEEAASLYRGKNIILAVNHVRRWEGSYLFAADMVKSGKIGNVKAVSSLYPSQVFNIGSHLFDVVRMIIRRDPVSACGTSQDIQEDDPGISGWILFEGNIPCTVTATGRREDLIFELDVIGDEGRIRITENGDRVEYFSFKESERYSGYREPVLIQPAETGKTDRFAEAVNDIVMTVNGEKKQVNCTGTDGFYALAMSRALRESAESGGMPAEIARMPEKHEGVCKEEEDVKVSAV